MSKNISDYKGFNLDTNCIGCAREQGKISQNDTILRTKYFDAHQDFEIPIPGFIIVSTRRHIQSIDEFTEEEKNNFVEVITKVRKALRDVLKIEVVYLYQEEDTSHHFHLWIFPRYDWMEKFGKKIQSVRPIMEYAKKEMKTDENLKIVQQSLKTLRNFISDKE